MFISFIKTAFRDLWAKKVKTSLTMLGIVIGITAVIIILSVGQGVQRNLLSELESYGQNVIYVMGGSTKSGGLTAYTGAVKTLTWDDFKSLKESSLFPNVTQFSASSYRAQAHIKKRDSDIMVPIQGSDNAYFDMLNYSIEEGRGFTSTEDTSLARVAILAPGARQKLFGSFSPLGEFVRVNNTNFRVIGVLSERAFERATGAREYDLIYVPPRAAMKLILGEDNLLMIGAEVDDVVNIDLVKSQMERFLRRKHQLQDHQKNDFSVMGMQEFLDVFDTVTTAMTLFLFAVTAISLIVGGIGIMNIMLASVVQRTKEVGLRKALGASNKSIIFQFLTETIVIMLISAVIGIIIGVIVSYTIAQYGGWGNRPVALISIPLALGVSFAFGIIFGLYPAFKAAKMDPITALKYE
jgi:putative ABC transport system permease protein